MIAIDAATVIADLLARGHAVEFRARGDSMYPAIRAGDLLHVEPLSRRGLRRGDVILTAASRGLTAHRLVGVAGDCVLTRGDNASAHDPPLVPSRILGRVTRLERAGIRHTVSSVQPILLALVRQTRAAWKRWKGGIDS